MRLITHVSESAYAYRDGSCDSVDMAMDGKELGELILRVLTSRGMIAADLARATGLPQNTVSDLINGKRASRPGTLAKVETALGWRVGLIRDLRSGAASPAEVGIDVLPRTAESPNVSGRPPSGLVDWVPGLREGLSESAAAEIEARMVAEAWRAKREIIQGA